MAGAPAIRVLHLCAVDFTVRRFIAPLAHHLRMKGCDVAVACTPGPHWQELEAGGLRMIPVRMARTLNVLSHLMSLVRIVRLLRREKPDVLHVHTPVASLIGRLAGRIAKVPVIIYTAHGFYFHDRMKPWKRRVHIALEKIAARGHDYLFCVSQEDARAAENLGIERPNRVFLIRNGVDGGRFDPNRHKIARPRVRQALGIPEDASVITIIGRVTREKGFIEFLHAARILASQEPDIHFLCVGDTLPSDRDRIRAQLDEIAGAPELDGRVHFTGMRDDIPELLAASDFFTLPSYREGLPVSVLEAMMMELPVVATRIRGCREAVSDGSSGFLVEPGSAQELAEALIYLLRHPDVSAKFGAAGRRRALDTFALRPHLELQWNLYRQVLAEKRK